MKKKQKQNIIKEIFGGLNITWPRLIISSIIIGVYTALMAMLVPDGNSFHDIAATLEWWILFAVIIIVNSKKPLEAALKTFVFFLISQPLVYLLQVPFSWMGWQIFQYYPYWFIITLLTFPGAYIGWYIKKNEWYSGVILSIATCLLAMTGIQYIRSLAENPPNHLLTVAFCFGIIPILVLAILKGKTPRIVAATITIIFAVVFAIMTHEVPYEAYNQSFMEEYNIVFVGKPRVTKQPENGNVEIINYDEDQYNFKVTIAGSRKYIFTVTDDVTSYDLIYYYDEDTKSVVIRPVD